MIEEIINFTVNNFHLSYGICFIITFVLVRFDLVEMLEYKRTWRNFSLRFIFSFMTCWIITPLFLMAVPFIFCIAGLYSLLKELQDKLKIDLDKPPKWL